VAASQPGAGTLIDPVAVGVDLRRAPLADLFAIDFRLEDRDFWNDEAAVWDRLLASWAGLDDAAWRLPGAAKSDAGGPDWSMLDHVGHLVDWLEIAVAYVERALVTGEWPADDDYEGGDFDRFNEDRRDRFATVAPAELRRRLVAGRAALLPVARRLDMATIRSDAAWGWVYSVLHGHDLDHLRVIEPWADSLRRRQVQNDPFGVQPEPVASALAAGRAAFWADESSVTELFRETVLSLPDAAWAAEVTPGWTVGDHVGHLTAWFAETTAAIEEHRPGAPWRPLPAEGVEAWNEADVARRRARGATPATLRDEFEAGRDRLIAAVKAMPDDDWLDPEGFGWAYEDLHGHVRAHLAMIGPFAARVGWPKDGSG
jgi:Mycothiol maleylpyruvate isomerase N-terminal domain/DinB superfamily